jgi:subfamily B ATP-binding cassette protein HlyB/CyaB
MTHIVKNRTVIVIAHRLAALRPCNRIYSVVDGRIAEHGSHDELIKSAGGFYARLWALQNRQSVPEVMPHAVAKVAA